VTSVLRQVRARFADDNPLLGLALGLVSSFERLDRILDAYAPEAPFEGEAPVPSAEDGGVAGAAGVDFVLGLVAFRARVEARLGEAAASGAAPVVGPLGASFEEGGESLWR
jgi:hypothetical protein